MNECEVDHKQGWALKNWCFQTVVLEKTLESPLDNKEIKPVNPKGNQLWIFIGRMDPEAAAPVIWPPDVKSLLIGKHPVSGENWGQEEKGVTEDEMTGWHHWLRECEFEQTQGDSDGQRSLCAAVHGVTKSWTRLSNWTTRTKMNTCCYSYSQMRGGWSRTTSLSGVHEPATQH